MEQRNDSPVSLKLDPTMTVTLMDSLAVNYCLILLELNSTRKSFWLTLDRLCWVGLVPGGLGTRYVGWLPDVLAGYQVCWVSGVLCLRCVGVSGVLGLRCVGSQVC